MTERTLKILLLGLLVLVTGGLLAPLQGCRMIGTVNSTVDVKVSDAESSQQEVTYEVLAYDAKGAVVKPKYPRSAVFENPDAVKSIDYVVIESIGYEPERVQPGPGIWEYSTGHGGGPVSNFLRKAAVSLKRSPPPTTEMIPALVASLISGTKEQKMATLRVLQRSDLRPVDAIPALVTAMNEREEGISRGMHVLARDELLRIKGKVRVVSELLTSAEKSVDVYQRGYLHSIAQVIALDADGTAAEEVTRRLLTAQSTTSENKDYILQLFSRAAPPDPAVLLSELEKLNAVELRYYNGKALIDYSAEATKGSLIRRLGSLDPLSHRTVEAIHSATNNGDREVLIAAAEALGRQKRVDPRIVSKLTTALLSVPGGDGLMITGRPIVAALSRLGSLGAAAAQADPAIPRLLEFCTTDPNVGRGFANFGRVALEAIGSPAAQAALGKCSAFLGPASVSAPGVATGPGAIPQIEVRKASTYPLRGYKEIRRDEPFDHDRRTYLAPTSELVNDDFQSATTTLVSPDVLGAAQVQLTLNDEGARKLHALTKENIGQRLAILVDSKPVVFYVIAEPLEPGRMLRIASGLTAEQAERLGSAYRK